MPDLTLDEIESVYLSEKEWDLPSTIDIAALIARLRAAEAELQLWRHYGTRRDRCDNCIACGHDPMHNPDTGDAHYKSYKSCAWRALASPEEER